MARSGALAVTALLLFLTACGPAPVKGLRAGPEARILAIEDDAALKLEDGAIVRLAALDFPKGPPAAVASLKKAALGRKARLYFDGAERDLYGALSAQVYVRPESGGRIWLQRSLVEAGLARVAPQAADRAGALGLLPVEEAARASRKGLWRNAAFAVRPATPEVLSGEIGAFVVVEGKVVSVGRAARRVFLNFGGDYKTDFTATIPEDAWNSWPGGAPFLLNLKDERVRVRGVLQERNGPCVEIVSPAQIEVLGAPSGNF